ncbi:MAG: phage tail tape measure protein [Phycisphaerae bacterium]|nr:phage tail tape measure protein [Phycisphaerae bacterium]
MANTTSIRAGRAFVELFADDSKLVRGLRSAEHKLRAFGNGIRTLGLKMMAIGAGLLTPLIGSAKAFSKMGDEVAKMSKRTGLSVETLSELKFVASQTGTEFATLENGVRKMQRSIYDAGRGLSTAVDALADLGLTYKDLEGLSPEEQFKLLADRISKIKDPTKKAAIAMSLFGRTGTNLLPMFEQGAAGINALQEEARRLGLTMRSEDAKAAEDFTDAMDKLWKVVKMTAFHVGAALAPALQKITDVITNIAVKINAWIQQNHAVIVSIGKIALAVIAGGAALVVLGTAISGLGLAFGKISAVITGVGTVFKMLGSAIAFLISPIGLVITAVGALGVYLVYTTDVAGKSLDWLGQKFSILKDDAIASYQGIADAMAAGDIALAAKILWLTLKMEWTRGVNVLEKAWLNFRNFFIRIGYDAFYGMVAAAQTVWHGLEVGWIETTAFFSRCWQGFVSFFAKTWENIKAGAQKAWNWIKSLFDDSFDLQTENKMVEDQRQQAIGTIEDEKQRKLAEREAERQSQRDQAARMNDTTLEEIGRQHAEKYKALDDEYDARMAENTKDLEAARKEWKDSIGRAKDKRAEKELEKPAAVEKANTAWMDVGDVLTEAANKISVTGTFNATAAWGLGTGSAADRTAKASEETARNTKRLLDEARNNGATFS